MKVDLQERTGMKKMKKTQLGVRKTTKNRTEQVETNSNQSTQLRVETSPFLSYHPASSPCVVRGNRVDVEFGSSVNTFVKRGIIDCPIQCTEFCFDHQTNRDTWVFVSDRICVCPSGPKESMVPTIDTIVGFADSDTQTKLGLQGTRAYFETVMSADEQEMANDMD